jgi:uncharacterized protein (TIGR02145 family)
MSDNGIIEKYCYDNTPDSCSVYGGLYQWDEIMQYTTQEGTQGICPEGWHIPDDEEWKILYGCVDTQYGVGDEEWDQTGLMGYDAGKRLKSICNWNANGNGTDIFGFTALAGGYRSLNGNIFDLSNAGYWWSSVESTSSYARSQRLFYHSDKGSMNVNNKARGCSVRCIKD